MTPKQKKQMEKAPFPISFSCVDMIVTCPETNEIVFIKKAKDDLLRLPGGMVDTTDFNYLMSARRELEEEIGLPADAVLLSTTILESFLTADTGRYEPGKSKHRLRTSLFAFQITKSQLYSLVAGDDAQSVGTYPLDWLYDIHKTKQILPGHVPLIYLWFGTFLNLG